jgi:hypothetical protein
MIRKTWLDMAADGPLGAISSVGRICEVGRYPWGKTWWPYRSYSFFQRSEVQSELYQRERRHRKLTGWKVGSSKLSWCPGSNRVCVNWLIGIGRKIYILISNQKWARTCRQTNPRVLLPFPRYDCPPCIPFRATKSLPWKNTN